MTKCRTDEKKYTKTAKQYVMWPQLVGMDNANAVIKAIDTRIHDSWRDRNLKCLCLLSQFKYYTDILVPTKSSIKI